MSMLSAQCDELRSMAESVGLAMPQAATLMMGAADAIDRLDAENAKLRELCHDLRKEYAYLRARPRRFYVQHEARMAAIDARMRELGIEVVE